MSIVRGQVDSGGNYIRQQMPGDKLFDMDQLVALTTAGNGTWLAALILSGVINRSGPGAPYTDTTDTADALIAANPSLSVGDSFRFIVRNTVAQAATLAGGTGVELGTNTAIGASAVREYMLTCLSNKRAAQYAATTVNGSPTISALTQAQVESLMPGMGVTGTGIAANSVITAVNPAAGTVTLNNNATASGSLVALSFFPRFTLQGLISTSL